MGVFLQNRAAVPDDIERIVVLHPGRETSLPYLISHENTHAIEMPDGNILALWGWEHTRPSTAEVWITLGHPVVEEPWCLKDMKRIIMEQLKNGLEEEPEITRIQAVLEENARDARFAEYLGFSFEGTVRGYFKGKDGWMYGMTREDVLWTR